MKKLRMTTPGEVRQALTKIANWVLNGEVDSKQANSAIYACSQVLSSIRIDEQEKRLAALEATISELEAQRQ